MISWRHCASVSLKHDRLKWATGREGSVVEVLIARASPNNNNTFELELRA